MSYVEHGPRIFLANRHSIGMPLIYGDYVLPKKRLEGRLKLHDSCSDIRAWSPNSLENSRYFRELAEHDSTMGKIIPFNVMIDNIIRFNAQAHSELREIKKELRKYKSLKLTAKQEEYLQNLDNTTQILSQKTTCLGEPLQNILVNDCKTRSAIPSNSCFSIHIPYEEYFQSDVKNLEARKNQLSQMYFYSLNAHNVYKHYNNYNLKPSFRSSVQFLPAADYTAKTPMWIEYSDAAVQVDKETQDVEVQITAENDQCFNKIMTLTAISQTLFTSKYSDEDNNAIQDKNSLPTSNNEDQSFECGVSYSVSSQDTESSSESNSAIAESDFDLHTGIHKGFIIQKDSEIIVLKNELCVRDAELKELRDMNKHLEVLLKEKEDSMHSQERNLKVLHDKLLKLGQEHNYEVEELEQKLYKYKYLMEQLKQELSDKCESCYFQAQEIEKLQKKFKEMEQQAEEGENPNAIWEQLESILQEKDELQKQYCEQNSIIIDQEEKLKHLSKLIKEMSVKYGEQLETKDMIVNLKAEIEDKNMKISQYENQLESMKGEISEFFNNLRNSFNSLEELNEGCEGICACTKCDLDIGAESNNILYNINIIMTRFQSYKTESKNLLQQVGDLKNYIETDKQQTYFSQSLRSLICESLGDGPGLNLENTTQVDDKLLNVTQSKHTLSRINFQDSFNITDTANSVYEEVTNLNSHGLTKECHNYILKMSKINNRDEVEKEIIEYLTYFLVKLHSLVQKLQIYAEIERPLLIKQTYHFYEILRDTQSAISISEDITLKKKLIIDLCKQHREEYKKYNIHIKQLPNDLLHMQNKINEFIETLLCQLLNNVLHVEKKDLYDKKLDCAFEIHLSYCMDRLNTALQGVGDQRIQIVQTIEEQQKELQKKNIEIAQLKNEVAQQLLVCIGEGDCANDEKSESITVQEFNIISEPTKDSVLVLQLEEELLKFKMQLFKYRKNCSDLRKRNKNLNNIKNRFKKKYHQMEKHLLITNKKMKKLVQQSHELLKMKELKIILENKVDDMEKKLFYLRSKSDELELKLAEASTVINLNNNIDKNDHSLMDKVAEYENVIGQKHLEIIKLEDENKLLYEKVKSIENRLVEMNETILSLTEQNDKINIIYNMQDDLTKLNKTERKLKVELNNLRAQLLSDQNNNKTVNDNLNALLQENETLQKNVEYWKSTNVDFSSILCIAMAEEKLKDKLYDFSNKIYAKIVTLKEQLYSEQQILNNQFNRRSQDKHDQQVEFANDNVTKDLLLASTDQKREAKGNEIEKLEIQQLNSDSTKSRILKCDSVTLERFNSSDDNTLKMRHEKKHPEYMHNKNEIEILLKEIEIKKAEITRYKEVVKHLAQEKANLCAILKSQTEEYQDKLTLMKKNYDCSLNALSNRHKANVEILQKQFEDNMNNERCFDSESWLQSLNMKELTELYIRISGIINSNYKYRTIRMGNEDQCLLDNVPQKQFYTKTDKAEKTFQLAPTNIYEKELSQSKAISSILIEQDSFLQNQWQFVGLGNDSQKYPTIQTEEDKLNFQYNFGERHPELENKYHKEKQTEKDNKRWNFINQCSAYHKLSNACEYSRILHTD